MRGVTQAAGGRAGLVNLWASQDALRKRLSLTAPIVVSRSGALKTSATPSPGRIHGLKWRREETFVRLWPT